MSEWRAYDGRGLKAPAECIDFAVVDETSGKEVARVWTMDDAHRIAAFPALLAICSELEGAIDDQTYDYAKTFHGDIPDDAEFNVNLTWKQLHALTVAINKAHVKS